MYCAYCKWIQVRDGLSLVRDKRDRCLAVAGYVERSGVDWLLPAATHGRDKFSGAYCASFVSSHCSLVKPSDLDVKDHTSRHRLEISVWIDYVEKEQVLYRGQTKGGSSKKRCKLGAANSVEDGTVDGFGDAVAG